MFEHISLKGFQQNAVEELSKTFCDLWRTGKYRLPIIFKAPTGSGKTIMMADFLKYFDSRYMFDEKKAYVWVSFGGDESYNQSKKKITEYFGGNDHNFKDFSNLREDGLLANQILFINWSKIKSKNKEDKILRSDNEISGELGLFDTYIENTHNNGLDIVMIIDEAHIENNTTLSNEIKDLINPRIVIEVSATPRNMPTIFDIKENKAGCVVVNEDDVRESGLIKKRLLIQTEEDINALENKEQLDEDSLMLELAYNKRLELKKIYEENDIKVNPLMLIQLPSDFNSEKFANGSQNKKDITLQFLKKKGVNINEEVAIWLSNEKTEDLDSITSPTSPINYLLFKVAPATGWDCPRADVLVMFREIVNPSFHTQIIGRIKRMPEGHHYDNETLNSAYIFTNYNKKHIRDIKETQENKPLIYYTEIKEDVERLQLPTVYHQRGDFNDIRNAYSFQKIMLNSLHKTFGTSNDIMAQNENYKALKGKVDLESKEISNTIIVNGKIESFDNFINEIQSKSDVMQYNLSFSDKQKLLNLLCYTTLKEQTIDEAKFNASRSWVTLKNCLIAYFLTYTNLDQSVYDCIIINGLMNKNSLLNKAITDGLIEYRKEHNLAVLDKVKRSVGTWFDIPNSIKQESYTDDYEERNFITSEDLKENEITADVNEIKILIKKNIYKKFYIKKDYKGKVNELKFIKFLEEQENVVWWHKQPDKNMDAFAIEYYNSQDKKLALFYPDFIVQGKKYIYLFDTKGGWTAKSIETKDKNEALQKWMKEYKDLELKGGIVIFKNGKWFLNQKENYIYENDNDWEELKIY